MALQTTRPSQLGKKKSQRPNDQRLGPFAMPLYHRVVIEIQVVALVIIGYRDLCHLASSSSAEMGQYSAQQPMESCHQNMER